MPSESIPEDERLALARALRHVGEDAPERTPENREEIARLFGEENPEGAEDYGAVERRAPRVRLLHVLIGLLVLACLALVVPLGLDFFGSDESGEVPVIAANEAPDKVRPDEPGGLQVPHQDVEVMNPSETQPVERLLPPPESPEPLPGTAGGATEGTSLEAGGIAPLPERPTAPDLGAPDLGTTAESLAPAAESPPAPPSDLTASVPEAQPSAEVGTVEVPSVAESLIPAAPEAPAEAAAPTAQETPVAETAEAAADDTASPAPAPEAPPKPAAEAPAKPAATQEAAVKPTAPAAGGEGIYIQLGSLSNKDAIPKEWARLQKAFPDFLGDMQLAVQSVTLDDRGTFHRIQTGPLPNRGTAEELCAFLKDAKQACIVVKR